MGSESAETDEDQIFDTAEEKEEKEEEVCIVYVHARVCACV